MPSLLTLKPLIHEQPTEFASLVNSCGRFIDVWLADGGEPTDDEIVGFYSLWSQSLDAQGRDERDFFDWAYPFFVRYCDEVMNNLKNC